MHDVLKVINQIIKEFIKSIVCTLCVWFWNVKQALRSAVHPRSPVFGVLHVSKALGESMPTAIWLVAGSKQIWDMVDRYACI